MSPEVCSVVIKAFCSVMSPAVCFAISPAFSFAMSPAIFVSFPKHFFCGDPTVCSAIYPEEVCLSCPKQSVLSCWCMPLYHIQGLNSDHIVVLCHAIFQALCSAVCCVDIIREWWINVRWFYNANQRLYYIMCRELFCCVHVRRLTLQRITLSFCNRTVFT